MDCDTSLCHMGSMSAVPRCSHIHRRGAVYHYRRRVPEGLVEAVGRAVWRESLGTKDLEEAKRLARLRDVAADQEIDKARARLGSRASAPLTAEDVRRIAHNELAHWLADDEEQRMAHGFDAVENAESVLTEFASDWRRALAEGDWRPLIDTAALAVDFEGRWYPAGDPSLAALAQELLKARVRYADMVGDRQQGRVVETPAPIPVIAQAAPAAANGPTLGDLIDRYRSNRVAAHGQHSTDRKYSHVFKALEEALGRQRPVLSIRRVDCEDVRDLLRELPQHAGKRYPGLSLRDAVDEGRRAGFETLSANTVATYMQNLAAILNYAVQLDWLAKNPAKGMGKKAPPAVRRQGFSPDDLRVLFTALVEERERAPWKYWVSALGVYTGARLNEVCQLRTNDVGVANGVAFLDFTLFEEDGSRAEDKRLKNAASERKVPVPPALIAAGFLDFVAAARLRGQTRLFPELRLGPDGTYSHGFSKWFARAMDAVGLSSRALVFHSFRHGFRDACRLAGIDEETASALGGWAQRGQASKYGNAAMLPVLERAATLIEFDGFTLPTGSPLRGASTAAEG